MLKTPAKLELAAGILYSEGGWSDPLLVKKEKTSAMEAARALVGSA
jgi:hypothetical protein